MYYHYNKSLRKWAGKHRLHSAKAEIKIWKEVLRARKLKGYAFLRQRPMLNYIVDFFCKDLKLIIEIDGWTHEDPATQKRDELKQKQLEDLGYHLLRFTNYQVLFEIEAVKQELEEWIDNFEGHGDDQ
jgi:very-short-patch-repair endonuclease